MDQDQSHSMRSLSILGFILLGAAAGAGVTASTASPSTSLKLNILDGRPSVSNVFLNGRGPYRFLLDTGAQSNQIDTAVAEELAVTATFRTDFVTAAGSLRVAGARLAEVTLGSARAENQEFLFTNLEAVHALSFPTSTILSISDRKRLPSVPPNRPATASPLC